MSAYDFEDRNRRASAVVSELVFWEKDVWGFDDAATIFASSNASSHLHGEESTYQDDMDGIIENDNIDAPSQQQTSVMLSRLITKKRSRVPTAIVRTSKGDSPARPYMTHSASTHVAVVPQKLSPEQQRKRADQIVPCTTLPKRGLPTSSIVAACSATAQTSHRTQPVQPSLDARRRTSPKVSTTTAASRQIVFEYAFKHRFSEDWVPNRKVGDFATKDPFHDVHCRGCKPSKPMTRCYTPKTNSYWWACSGDYRKPGDSCKSTISDAAMQQYLDGILYSPWSPLTTDDPHPGYHRTIVSPAALFFHTVLHPPVIPANQDRIAALASYVRSPTERWFEANVPSVFNAVHTPPFVAYGQSVDYTLQLPTQQTSVMVYKHQQCRDSDFLVSTIDENAYGCAIPVHGFSSQDDFPEYGAHIAGWLFYAHAAEWIMMHLPSRASLCFSETRPEIAVAAHDRSIASLTAQQSLSTVIHSDDIWMVRRRTLSDWVVAQYDLHPALRLMPGDERYEAMLRVPNVYKTCWASSGSTSQDELYARHSRALHVFLSREDLIGLGFAWNQWIQQCQ